MMAEQCQVNIYWCDFIYYQSQSPKCSQYPLQACHSFTLPTKYVKSSSRIFLWAILGLLSSSPYLSVSSMRAKVLFVLFNYCIPRAYSSAWCPKNILGTEWMNEQIVEWLSIVLVVLLKSFVSINLNILRALHKYGLSVTFTPFYPSSPTHHKN